MGAFTTFSGNSDSEARDHTSEQQAVANRNRDEQTASAVDSSGPLDPPTVLIAETRSPEARPDNSHTVAGLASCGSPFTHRQVPTGDPHRARRVGRHRHVKRTRSISLSDAHPADAYSPHLCRTHPDYPPLLLATVASTWFISGESTTTILAAKELFVSLLTAAVAARAHPNRNAFQSKHH